MPHRYPYSLFGRASAPFTSAALLLGLLFATFALTGCELLPSSGALGGTPFAYRKSVADLNQKASELLQQGDVVGAVARLESARDLAPDDAGILFNLAIATSTAAGSDAHYGPKGIQLLEAFLKQFPQDSRYLQAVQSLAVLAETEANRVGASESKSQEESDSIEKPLTPQQQQEKIALLEQALQCYQLLQDRGNSNPAVSETIKALQKTLAQLKLTPKS